MPRTTNYGTFNIPLAAYNYYQKITTVVEAEMFCFNSIGVRLLADAFNVTSTPIETLALARKLQKITRDLQEVSIIFDDQRKAIQIICRSKNKATELVDSIILRLQALAQANYEHARKTQKP